MRLPRFSNQHLFMGLPGLISGIRGGVRSVLSDRGPDLIRSWVRLQRCNRQTFVAIGQREFGVRRQLAVVFARHTRKDGI